MNNPFSLSRQLLWQMKKEREGCCRQCGKEREIKESPYCNHCREVKRVTLRNRYRLKVGIPLNSELSKRGRPIIKEEKAK